MADTVEHVLDQTVLPSDSLSTAAKRDKVWALVDDNNPGSPTTNRVSLHAFADSIIDDAMSDSSTNAIQNVVAKTYIDAAVATAVATREITRKTRGVRDAGFSLTAATTAAQRGTVLVNALTSLPAGSTLEYFGSDDFEIDNFTWTLKDNVTINMPNVTLRKPAASTSQFMIRMHKCRNTRWRFGIVDVNADTTAVTSRDVAFSLGGGYNNVLECDEILNMRRPWAAWNSGTAYSVGDGVYYGAFGVSGANMQWYYCIQAHTNQPPTEGGNAYWTEKANSAIEMDVYYRWTSGGSYTTGTIVWYGQAYWKATGTPTVGVAPGEGVANWALADHDAPNGWEIAIKRMHNPGQKGIRLGGDNTLLRDTKFSQDTAIEFNIPQTHTAFDYWRSGGTLKIQNVVLQDLSAEAGTNNEILYNVRVDGLMFILTKTRGTNTTTVKFQCMENFYGRKMEVIAPVQNGRSSFKITVQSTRSVIEDSNFSGWIGMEGKCVYRRCKFGHADNSVTDMFYALNTGRKLELYDCDIIGATNGIHLLRTDGQSTVNFGPDEDIYVILDDVRCTNVTYLFNDARRTDRITMRKVTGYTNFCNYLSGWTVNLASEGLNPYEYYGTAAPTGGYSNKGTIVYNTGAGGTKYWICTTSGYNVIGAKPGSGSVTRGAMYSDGADIVVVTTSGTIGSDAVFRTYSTQTASVWAAVS